MCFLHRCSGASQRGTIRDELATRQPSKSTTAVSLSPFEQSLGLTQINSTNVGRENAALLGQNETQECLMPLQQEVLRILGRLDDDKVVQILKLEPSIGDIEAAAMCLSGDHDVIVKSAHHTSTIVESIVEIVADDEEDASPE
jgi:hypothetical protein